MTRPPSTGEQRAALTVVTAAAVQQLTRLWPSLRGRRPDVMRDRLKQVVPALADRYGSASSALAVDVYSVLRDAAKVDEPFVPRPAERQPSDVLDRIVGWAVEPIYSRDPNPDLVLYRVSGGLQKAVADDYRDTIQDAAIEDPKSGGWQRSARTNGCPFCVMLAGRGAVYSEATVDFGAHRDCHCLAVPWFGGTEKPVKPYEPTNRNITAADRERVRRWIAEHH